jgi:WD40 repeat protein
MFSLVQKYSFSSYAYSIEYGRILDTLSAHEDAVSKIEIHSGNMLSTSWDNYAKLWKCTKTGFNKTPLWQHQTDDAIWCSNFDSTGNLGAIGTESGDIVVFDVRAKKPLFEFTGHMDSITDISFVGKNSQQIITCSKDKTVKQFTTSGQEIKTFQSKHNESIRCLATDGSSIVCGGDSGIVNMWGMDGNSLVDQDFVAGSAITSLTVVPDGSSLSVGTSDGDLLYFKC